MAERAGVLVARLHYYETEGLIESLRTSANHRRYDRRELRRIAITRIAQSVGVPFGRVRGCSGSSPARKSRERQDMGAGGGGALGDG
jgi:MerR family redox-sensitive transcriptional activator SoxR